MDPRGKALGGREPVSQMRDRFFYALTEAFTQLIKRFNF